MNEKIELFAPCFPGMNAENVTGEDVFCFFDFKIGNFSIDCMIMVEEKSDSVYLEPLHNPENGKDVDFKKLVVDTMTLAQVTRSDFDESPMGLKFKLTDSQVNEINEQLREIAIQELKDSLV
jgi:hypothetical protein